MHLIFQEVSWTLISNGDSMFQSSNFEVKWIKNVKILIVLTFWLPRDHFETLLEHETIDL